MANVSSPPKRSIGIKLFFLFLKLCSVLLMVLVPLFGAWLLSSLAAYNNGPQWLTIIASLLLFPLLPLSWDLFSSWRRGKKKDPAPRILFFWDRMILRTLVLNLLFLGGLLWREPKTAFTALSARGDWMLDGFEGDTANSIRSGLFRIASTLEWLYLASDENPFLNEKLTKKIPPPPPPAPRPKPPIVQPPKEPTSASQPASTPTETPAPNTSPTAALWPMPQTLHPLIANMPKEAETSIESVAAYIKKNESDPFMQVKAIHDYVADRVSYDVASYRARIYPPYDPETVFRTRSAVCAGYSMLFGALADQLGFENNYIGGVVRGKDGDISGDSHAWSAVKIEGNWYLFDTTWDSGSVDGNEFKKEYRTDYLFTPPEIFGLDHLPEEDAWQLREKPIDRGEFIRQQMVTSTFYREGYTLLSPQRSQVTVEGSITIEAENTLGRFMMATATLKDGAEELEEKCGVSGDKKISITCKLPAEGRYEIELYSNTERYGTFDFVGKIQANNNP